MIDFAVISSVPLSVLTLILPLAGSVASPITTAILFFFIRWPTPELSCFATARERFTTASRSKPTFSALSPNSLARCIRWKISEVRSSALVGMQPQFRQMPPRFSRSTMTVESPSCAARIAAT